MHIRTLLGLIILVVLGSCKKIDYAAVFALDEAKNELSETRNPKQVLQKYLEHDHVPAIVKSSIRDLIDKDRDEQCLSLTNISQIVQWVDQIRSYLLFRSDELPVALICNYIPAKILAHQLNPSEQFPIIINGINLGYETLAPKYIRGNTEIDIPSLYCKEETNRVILHLGGPNGLPIDDEVGQIILGHGSSIVIPILHFSENNLGLVYQTHLKMKGWTKAQNEGLWSGTKGEGLRVESFMAELQERSNCGIRYKVHQEDLGTSDWKYNGEEAGAIGQNKRIEAIWIELIDCTEFTIEYQGHIEDIGDTAWIKEGKILGTQGSNQRLEAIRLKILPNKDL